MSDVHVAFRVPHPYLHGTHESGRVDPMQTIARLLILVMGSVLLISAGRMDRSGAALTSPCTPGDSLSNSWVQGILNAESREETRHSLGLSHLQGQQVVVLGSEPGDEVICSELYSRLAPESRLEVEKPDAQVEVIFYRVGDRYLVLWGSTRANPIGRTILISFDMQFNRIQALLW